MTTPNRPPSCDLPPEHYDQHKGIKPCPICGHDKVGWGAGDIYINEFTNGEVAVQCDHCGVQVNDRTYRESKGAAVRQWNSIPRRSEVLELLRLVDEVTGWRDDAEVCELIMKMDSRFSDSFGELIAYTEKLRKEMGE